MSPRLCARTSNSSRSVYFKQKEIKFRDRGYVLEGRRGNLTFALYNDNTKEALEEQTYYVVVRHKEIESLGVCGGLRHLAAVGGFPGPLAPFLQRLLHPQLGQFRAIPQALIRQAGFAGNTTIILASSSTGQALVLGYTRSDDRV